jgi:hypothetical protein
LDADAVFVAVLVWAFLEWQGSGRHVTQEGFRLFAAAAWDAGVSTRSTGGALAFDTFFGFR